MHYPIRLMHSDLTCRKRFPLIVTQDDPEEVNMPDIHTRSCSSR